ncbi:MAG TPA: STAS domain-containing protein [Burkholderiales bacterium]|nr:STAS domain-containing protein [Burkholderiales bacterium]
MVFPFFRNKDQEEGRSDRASAAKKDEAGSRAAKTEFGTGTEMEVLDRTSELSAAAEEAAMLYANNLTELTYELLLTTVKAGAPDLEAWLMLFDLYQQKGMQKEFEELALNFVVKFERSPPAWREIKATNTTLAQQDGTFALSGELNAASGSQFDEMARIAENTDQLRLDFSEIESVAPTGCVLLLQTLRNIRKGGHRIAITGFGHLVQMMQSATNPVPEPEQLILLLELYQVKGMQKEFEDLALQYAMKFEVSPPSWEPLPQEQAQVGKESPEPAPAELEANQEGYAMHGEVVGSADPQLQGISGYAAQRQDVNIDMSDVRRMDFVSCGMFLNILAGLKQSGKNITITGANEMILSLWRVMEVHKVATLIRKK